MLEKRRRGRPVGSEIDDSRLLDEIADLVLSKRMKPTSAMRKVMNARKELWVAQSEDAMLRRLQSKWKERKAILLIEAERRSTNRQRPATSADALEALRRMTQTAAEARESFTLLVRMVTEARQLAQQNMEPIRNAMLAVQRFQDMGRVTIPDFSQMGRFQVPDLDVGRIAMPSIPLPIDLNPTAGGRQRR